MAIFRESPKCVKCGGVIHGIYKDQSDLPSTQRVIGDTFIGWDYGGHECVDSGEDRLKMGDKVKITEDLSELNSFMYRYAGKEATVTAVENGSSTGQIVKLDIDNGEWFWSFNDKLNQIFKL